jgi:serpin B
VEHKAHVDVNEKGTEAAAATAVGVMPTSMPPLFRADHPFFFVIRDNQTETILFLGRLANPKAT